MKDKKLVMVGFLPGKKSKKSGYVIKQHINDDKCLFNQGTHCDIPSWLSDSECNCKFKGTNEKNIPKDRPT